MKHSKKTVALLILLMSMIGSRTYAQEFLKFATAGDLMRQIRVKKVMQDNEYDSTGYEQGIFLHNPLMLNGKPLDYSTFGLSSEGELTVSKGAVTTGQTMHIPFYVYLRRDGNKVLIPGKKEANSKQMKIEVSEILKFAKPEDQLIIEPVNKEDGPAKRILQLLENGC